MNNILIGKYIQSLRKEKKMKQADLAEKMNVSFQAVSKWETGETLPDISLLLDLADVLETTVDRLLNGGKIVVKKSKKIRTSNVLEGFNHLEKLKECFGVKSPYYRGAIQGINKSMNIDDIENDLKDSYLKECHLAEAVISFLNEGYKIDEEEVEDYFESEKMRNVVKKYMNN